MMMIKQNIFLLILGFGLLSCTNDRLLIKQETEILNDIFPQIVSDNHFFPLQPPPPPQIIDNSGNIIDDTVKNPSVIEYNKFFSKLDENRNVISIEDSTNLIIAQSIVIKSLKENEHDKLIEIFNHQTQEPKFLIDVSQIKNTGKFELIKRSTKFQKDFNFKNYNGLDLTYYFFGNLIFSRPFLDDSEKNGFIIYSRDCGFECDRDFIFIIKKQNERWIISEKISM
jgi:hypothetical protein